MKKLTVTSLVLLFAYGAFGQDSLNVRLLGQVALPGVANGVAVSGNYAYVADDLYGLRIIDISDPSAPVETGFYDTPGFAQGVAVSGNYAYVADGQSGVRIINVSDPAAPVEVGFNVMAGESHSALAVALADSHAYIADEGGGLRVLDV